MSDPNLFLTYGSAGNLLLFDRNGSITPRIAIPYGMQFAPYTLYMGLRHGYTITAAGGGTAAMAPDIAQFLRSRY